MSHGETVSYKNLCYNISLVQGFWLCSVPNCVFHSGYDDLTSGFDCYELLFNLHTVPDYFWALGET